MTKKHGPWTIKATSRKYHHHTIEVNEDEVIKPDGSSGTYATIKIKAGASVLPLDEDGFVYLAKGFRYALGHESIEVVGGAIDDGESPGDAAKRELREELGIEASELIELGRVDPMTSIIDSPAHLFLATNLKFNEPQREAGEVIETIKMKLDAAVQMVMNSQITHGTSCVLIIRANNYLQKKRTPDGSLIDSLTS